MKPFDTKGEYTPEEVKAALAGINGTRQLSFRYERLDRNNQFIEEIDYVTKCSIENNALADIKRTAKLDILDTGTINYLQDRIKPYIRLAMPADKDYDDSVRALNPDVWWKMDDIKPATSTLNNLSIPDAINYNTRETAYVMTAAVDTQFSRSAYVLEGSATVRDEYWTSTEITDSGAFSIKIMSFSHPGMGFEIYFSKDATSDLELVFPLASDNPFDDYTSTRTFSFAFPRRGFYYTRVFTTATTTKQFAGITTSRPTRLEDSSGHDIYATGLNLNLRAPSLIGKGYAMQSVGGVQNIWDADDLNLTHKGAVVTNFWMQVPDGNTANVYLDASFVTPGTSEWSLGLDITYFTGDEDFGLSLHSYGWYGEMSIPKAKLYGTHMYSYYYYPDEGKASLYLDGAYVGEFVDSAATFEEGVLDFADSPIITLRGSFYGNNVVVDDWTCYFKPIEVTSLMDIYRDGIGAPDNTRSGYVEWPQGVFVLSSPTRQMVDGSTVTRSVEGYDQLVNLKEDSFDYRYSVRQGAKYTDAIIQVLQSAKMKNRYYFNDVDFTFDPNVTVNSETSIYLDTVDANSTDVWSKWGKSLKDIYLSAKIDGSTVAPARTFMLIEYVAGNTTKVFSMEANASTLLFNDNGFATQTTRNVVNHAYWRMRESNGYFYWETSPDYKTWSEMRKVKITVDPSSAESRFQFTAAHGVAKTGSGFHQVVAQAFDIVKANIADSTSTLPTAMEWEPGTPKLTIINDLLAAINFESATYNEDGMFVGRPYIAPSQRTPQFRYATDNTSVITGDVDQSVDLFAVPNKWVVVVSDPDRPMLVGTYTNADPQSPTSTVSRGRTIVDYRTEQNAPNQLTLDAQAARLAFEASQVYESVEFDTALMPIHQNSDVYEVVVDGLGISNKFSEVSWSMELKNGATMAHKIRRVVSV